LIFFEPSSPEKMGCQMRNFYTLKNEESTVIGNVVEILFMGLFVPADVSVTGTNVARSG